MKCPYCMTEFDISARNGSTEPHKCEECGKEISGLFIGNVMNKTPWFTMGMVGYSNHGKTVYVTSLFYLLRDVFMNGSHWPRFNLFALDNGTINMVFNRIDQLTHGQLPAASVVNFTEPCLIQFNHLPFREILFTSVYDIGGEVYEKAESITSRARLIAQADTLLFMISIKEEERWQGKIHELLNKYILGLHDHLQLTPREYQHLVVVFTKTDELVPMLPEELQNSLIDGDYKKYLSVDHSTLEQIRAQSGVIEQWLRDQHAAGFLNLARDSFKSVHFSMVSAIGQKPDGDRLHGTIQPEDPKNMLDPFLLAMGNHLSFPGEPSRKKGGLWRRMFGGGQAS